MSDPDSKELLDDDDCNSSTRFRLPGHEVGIQKLLNRMINDKLPKRSKLHDHKGLAKFPSVGCSKSK